MQIMVSPSQSVRATDEVKERMEAYERRIQELEEVVGVLTRELDVTWTSCPHCRSGVVIRDGNSFTCTECSYRGCC